MTLFKQIQKAKLFLQTWQQKLNFGQRIKRFIAIGQIHLNTIREITLIVILKLIFHIN